MSFADLRKAVRRMTTADPMLVKPAKPVEEDGSIQVGDGQGEIENHHRTYQDNGFGNAVAVASEVFEREGLAPALEVGGDKVKEHRQTVRGLLDKGCP